MRSGPKSAFNHVIVSLYFLCFLAGNAWSQTPKDWALGLAENRPNTRPHCTAVLIASQKALTARHCIDTQRSLIVLPGKGQKPVEVQRYQFPSERNLMFPLEDIAILHLQHAIRRSSFPQLEAQTLAPNVNLFGYGYGIAERCRVSGCLDLKRFQVRSGEILEGQRLFGLQLISIPPNDGPCRGDSGAGIYAKRASSFTLVGVLSGQMPELFAGQGLCRDAQALMTSIVHYRAWIAADGAVGKKQPPLGRAQNYERWSQLCQTADLGSPAWSLLQSLLLQSASALGGWTHPMVRNAVLRCQSLEKLIQRAIEQNRKFRIPASLLTLFQEHGLRANFRHLEVIDMDQKDLSILAQIDSLRSLHIIGLKDNVDVSILARLPQLEELDLRHGRHIKNLDYLSRHSLAAIKFVDIKN